MHTLVLKYLIIFIFFTSLFAHDSSDNKTLKLTLTSTEKAFLQTHPTVSYVYDPDWKPFEWTDGLGNHSGIVHDILHLIEQNSGLHFKSIQTQNWSESIEELKKSVPMASAIGITPKRAKYLNFTATSLFLTPYVLVCRQGEDYLDGFADIADKKVATIVNYTIVNILQKQKKELPVILLANLNEGFRALQNKKIDILIINETTARYYINILGYKKLKIAYKTKLNLDLRIAVQKKMPPELLAIINKGMQTISQKEVDKIYKKWTQLQVKKEMDWTLLFYIVGIGMSIILFFIFHTKKLNAMVEVQTLKINQQKKQLEKIIASFDKHVIATKTDIKGTIVYASEAYVKISGYRQDELIGESYIGLRRPDFDNERIEEIWDTLHSGKIWKGEVKNFTKEKDFYWTYTIATPEYDADNILVGFSLIMQDISDKKRIEKLSITDGLTDIYNRRYFNEIFPKIINKAKRENECVSLLYLDIDFFKAYNDTYGHVAGDKALIKFAHVLKTSLNRLDDYSFRVGGEEFAVVFISKEKSDALVFANTIKNNIKNLQIKHKSSSVASYMTASMGLITQYANEIHTSEAMYKAADVLLYEAKENGRNQIVSTSS